MASPSFVRPERDSTDAIRLGLVLYAVGLVGPFVAGPVTSPEAAGSLLLLAAIGWYFVAAFTSLDRLYLARVGAPWRPDTALTWGCLIPFLNVFSGYFYLRERGRHVPDVVDLERYGDETRHA